MKWQPFITTAAAVQHYEDEQSFIFDSACITETIKID